MSRRAWDEYARPVEPTWRDRFVAAVLFVGTLLWLVPTTRNVGVARDEGIYINGAETYQRYVEAVRRDPKKRYDKKTIEQYYRVNAEHPPATKHLYGLSWVKLRKGPVDPAERARLARAERRGAPPLSRSWKWLDDLTALRLPAMITAGLLVAFLYLFGTVAFGRLTGLLAALAYVCLPRVFYHSHLAGLDVPITAALFITVYGYYRSLWSWPWVLATGLLWGLALLTKFNAFFLPLLLLVHYGWATRRDFRHPLLAAVGLGSLLPLILLALAALVSHGGAGATGWGIVAGGSLAGLYLARTGSLSRPWRALRLTAPAVFFSMLVLGGAVLYLQWPWLWHDTVSHFTGYLRYHLDHTFYNTEYLGRNYNLPPFPVSYPFVLTLATFPLAFLVAAVGGLGLALSAPLRRVLGLARRAPLRRWWRGEPLWPPPPDEDRDRPDRGWWQPLHGLDRSPAFLVGLNALFWIGLIALPSTPIFGGSRLWMPSWPFMALLAGWAAQGLWRQVTRRWPGAAAQWGTAAALLAALTVPAALQTVHAGDVAPCWYSPIVGGPAGAADLGLKRQYWGFTTRRVLATLNHRAERDPVLAASRSGRRPARFRSRIPVYFHDTNHYSWSLYERVGLLSPRITYAGDGFPGIRRSRMALFLYEQHQVMWDYRIWQDYGTVRPDAVVTLDGVPLITLYVRRNRLRPTPPFFEDPPGFHRITHHRRR